MNFDPEHFDPSTLPTVYCHTAETAEQNRFLDLTAHHLRRTFPNGLLCAVHEDMAARAQAGRCGPWYRDLSHDPFPEGFYAFYEGRMQRFSFQIRRDPDGFWRPTAGGLCGFTLTDTQAFEIAKRDRLIAGRDHLTGEILLVRADNDRNPIIPRADWGGECNNCGLCCWSPRYGTGGWCDQLVPAPGKVKG